MGRAVTLGVIAGVLMAAAPALADRDHTQKSCPAHREQRSTEQVIHDHLAAVNAAIAGGDPSLVLCDYAEDATVVLTGASVTGHDQIGPAFGGFLQVLGGNPLTIDATTVSGPMVLLEYHGAGPYLVIVDAADTFVIDHGFIKYQTVHLNIAPR